MPPLIDLTGQKFGFWSVLKRDIGSASPAARWICECQCKKCTGFIKSIASADLRKGASRSCGSLRSQVTTARSLKHGYNKRGQRNPTYNAWTAMINRCTNANCPQFSYYGDSGITVYPAWLKFENFLADMGEKPDSELSLDRVNPNGNYEPSNCRWATAIEQAAHRRPSGQMSIEEVDEIAQRRSLTVDMVRAILEEDAGLRIVNT
jgi:hypothetical protein